MKKYCVLFSIILATTQAEAQPKKSTVINLSGKKVVVYTTAANTNLRLSQMADITFEKMDQPLETQPCVFLDASKTFQTMIGIGGALTDAAAETFYKLPKASQQEFLKAYYDKKEGIGYTIGRTNINSCDFSSDTYSYVEDNDESLKSFNLAHDEKYKIPFIKEAIAAAGGKLTMFVSPWSPPAWMKDNNDMLHGGKLKAEFRQNWANYYVKFINAYEAKGIPIWGLTLQNEPMAKQKWESCIYTAEEARDYVKQYLGPTLQKAGLSNKKLMVWDHNRDLVFQQASTILNDAEAAKYIWGVGFHWYETWTGSGMLFQNVQKVHEAYPDKNLMFTEGCIEKFSLSKIDDWSLGEKYGYSMINDFNAGTTGWTDWNILLDENGGPNHVGNFCFAPIHADTKTGKLMYTNEYYYIGHLSKFIKPGAKRITSAAARDVLLTTAYINPNGEKVVVVMNQSDKEQPFSLWMNGYGAPTVSQPHSIATFIIP